MLDEKTLLEYAKKIDSNIELEKLEIESIRNSFVNKMISNIKIYKDFEKVDFENIIPNEEYSILLSIDDLDFDVNELYMDLLMVYNYQLYIDTTGIQYMVKI